MGSPTLRIRLFGDLDLRHDGEALPLESGRAASLLAYLLLHREAPQPRQRLAFLLWPDSSETQARTNLRHLLHNLRRALPDVDRFLDVTPQTLQWRVGAPFWLDVATFEESVSLGNRKTQSGDLAALREAVELYRGDLVEGCYDEWILAERERLRQHYLDALERLVAALEAHGEYAQAIQYAERLLRHDPLHEETYRRLMRLHDARGDRARALRVYHACVATLERELGVEPSTRTREAYEALLPVERETVVAERHVGRVGGSPLVGRTPERSRLAELWRSTERGLTQLVLVSGEPGIGKTRLVGEFRSWCADRGALTAEARSYAAEGDLAYGPVVAWLRTEALKRRLPRLDPRYLTELARLLPDLHAEVPDLGRPEPLPESDQRRRLFDSIAQAILVTGEPLLLVADDIHWADRETLQFLHYLLRVEPDARLLVAATARREEIDDDHPLNDLLAGLQVLERFTEIEIGRLTRQETAVLVERLAASSLSDIDVDEVFAETEGNPLFVVEALRAGKTSRRTDGGWMSPKVQAAIQSRLAQLSEPARDLVGVAAAIGRAFTVTVLASASEAGEETLVRALDELWRLRIIREQGADAYDFAHDKIREVAYLGLSPARRRHLHLRVARALEWLNRHDPAPVSAQIAAHYERASSVDPAVTWYMRAADAAQRLYANTEAIRLLYRALNLLHTLPEMRERRMRELEILTALSTLLGSVEGFASSRLAAVQQDALDLATELAVELPPPLLRSLSVAYLSRGNFDGARQFGQQLHDCGAREDDDILRVEAAYVLGIAAFWQGQLEEARGYFESAVDRYRSGRHSVHLLRYGLDPRVICLSRLANTLLLLGYTDTAIQACDTSLALAAQIGHADSRGTALVFATMLALDMRDLERLLNYHGRLMSESPQFLWKPNQVATQAIDAFVEVLYGQMEAGIARIQHALNESRGVDHAPGFRATVVRLLLAAFEKAGDARSGLAAADRALAMDAGVRVWRAEVRRLRTVFLVALGASPQAVEVELYHALRVARDQGSRLLELRVAVSLLRHQMEQGDGPAIPEARDLVAGIVDTFPEPGNIEDVHVATMLLAECIDS